MKRYLPILSALLLTLLCFTSSAQLKKGKTDHYLEEAFTVLREEGDEEKGLELVNKQLRETPDNIDALILRVRLFCRKDEYGFALSDVNHALKVNKPKKSGVPMSTLYWWRGTIYRHMDDYYKSADAYKTAYELASKDDKEYLQSISFDYAQSLYVIYKLDEAEAVYRNMLARDEADQAAMVGLARNMIDREQYQQAVEILDKCQKYGTDYSEVYRFKMKAYDKLGETAKAIDAGLDWFDMDDEVNLDAVLEVLTKRPNYAEARIKARTNESDEPFQWKVLLCSYYQEVFQYADAVKGYDAIEKEYGQHRNINYYRSICYSRIGLNDLAIQDISRAMDGYADWEDFCRRGDYYRLAGDLDSAIEDFTSAIEEQPDECFAYYRRGWCYEMKGDKKKALEDYNVGIDLNEDYPYLYLMRGNLLLDDGKTQQAEADFQKILQLDTLVDDTTCRMYALHYLGRDKEAEEWMDKVIAAYPKDYGSYYDQACLYARMGRLNESIGALRTAFEKGYCSFSHIRLDDDLDPVRDLPEFKALVEEYKAKHTEYLKQFDFKLPDYRNNTLYL